MSSIYLQRVLGEMGKKGKLFALGVQPQIMPTRNTFILKRRWPPGLAKTGRRPVLKSRNYVYDLVEDTNIRKRENLQVILTNYVSGLGDKGDKVSVKPGYAYYKLLLPGLAVYASPENIKEFTYEGTERKNVPKFSSLSAEMTLNKLSTLVLAVVMNKENEWTLESWHIRMSFRKAGYIVPDYAIEMPKNSISGPNMDLQGKEFTVTVTVNKTEKVPVKCRIHHWSTKSADRMPYVLNHWLQPAEPLFSESKTF